MVATPLPTTSLNLNVPKVVLTSLKREAKRLGLTLPEYALLLLVNRNTLAATSLSATSPAPKTGAELVSYWQAERLIGARVIGMRTNGLDSAAYARQLRARATTRSRD